MVRRLETSRLVCCTTLVTLLVLGLVGAFAAGALRTNPADQRLAARAQVRLADLPPGWRVTTGGGGAGDDSCLAKPVATATGKSTRDFAWRDVAEASGRVGLFRTAPEAQRVFTVVSGRRLWDCLVAKMRRMDGVTATWQSRVPLQAVGAPAAGRELVVRIEQNGTAVLLGVHMDVAHRHRGVVMFIHMSIGGPVFTLAQESLVLRRMAARLP